MAAAAGGAAERAAMAGGKGFLALLVAALMFAGAVMGGEGRPPSLVGGMVDIENADNDGGLQRALQFAMAEYNKASNDMYSSRVVEIISAKRQIVSGVKYVMKVEIGRTTCPKPATNLQSCAFHDAPQMAKHAICDFVVYTVPWLNQIKLLQSKCE